MKAQEFFNNWKTNNAGNAAALRKLERDPALVPATEKLTGILEIKDIPQLEEIDLTNEQLSELTIINCPLLKKIILEDNGAVKVDFTKAKTSDDTSGGSPVNNILEEILLGDNDIKEINFKYSPELREIYLQSNEHLDQLIGLDELTKTDVINTKGVPDLVRPSHTNKINYWKEVVKIVKEKLGMDPTEDFKTDASGNVDFDALRTKMNDLVGKRIEKILGLLGLAKDSTDQQIEEKIEELKGDKPSSDYISKPSLVSSAGNSLRRLRISKADIDKLGTAASARDVEDSRNELINNQFSELQSKLNFAHYLNVGLGTLSVGILVILTWMILKDRNLLPGKDQAEEEE